MKRALIGLSTVLILVAVPAWSAAEPATDERALVAVTGDPAAQEGAAALAMFLEALGDPSVAPAELARHFAPDARLEWVATPTAKGPEAVVASLVLKLQDRATPRVTFKLIDAKGDGREVEVSAVANSPLAPSAHPGPAGRTLFAGAHVHLARDADGKWLITRWRVGKWSVGR